MNPRYGRYDRRSLSPRDRSPGDRFDADRRRPSNEVRSNTAAFQSNRDNFADGPRREPPRGPRALIEPRGRGYSGDYRGRGGRGRGRGWPVRDESRERGRDRDVDFRDRFRDERSRERERDRDRDRDRDWRDPYRSRRSPIGRPRSPPRDFIRDRERDGPVGPDTDRPRRNSREGPLSGGSPLSEPPFGPLPQRGGSFNRGRGRGGRGDWMNDRGRGRVPFDDRGDRYPRSRSQEGRWGGRERDERERDRYPDADLRPRDPRDDRDRPADLFRAKMDARVNPQESVTPKRDVSPPPVAPSAPAFGSVPNRPPSIGDSQPSIAGIGKPPPTAPRAFGERPSLGQEPPIAPMGLPKPLVHEGPAIPVGPRAQTQKVQRPSSKQWINPSLKKAPDSPKLMRSQTFTQPRTGPPRRESMPSDQAWSDRRPQSSDSKATSDFADPETRRRAHYSAEPGEIMSKTENDWHLVAQSDEHRRHSLSVKGEDTMDKVNRITSAETRQPNGHPPKDEDTLQKDSSKTKKRKRPHLRAVRFALPPKSQAAPDQDWDDSDDDDEDMSDYFALQIEKTEAMLSSIQKPSLPMEVVAHYAAISHGAMVKILNEGDDLTGLLSKVPAEHYKPKVNTESTSTPAINAPAQEVVLLPKEGPVSKEEPVVPKETTPIKDRTPPKEIPVVMDVVKVVTAPELAVPKEQPPAKEASPVVEEPPVKAEPVAQETSAPKQPNEDPVAKESITKQPIPREPIPKEPVVEEPLPKEPLPKEPLPKEPLPKQSIRKEPIAKEPITKEPITKELVAKEPITEEPLVKEPVVTKEPAATEVPPVVEETVPIKESPPITETTTKENEEQMEDAIPKEVLIPVEVSPAKETPAPESDSDTAMQLDDPSETTANENDDTPKPETQHQRIEPKSEEMEIDSVGTKEVPPAPSTSAPLTPPPAPAVPKEAPEESGLKAPTPAPSAQNDSNDNNDSNAPAKHAEHVIPPIEVASTISMDIAEPEVKAPSTPSQVEDEGDDDETESEDDTYLDPAATRRYNVTPPIDGLPQPTAGPWHEDSEFLASLDADTGMEDFILSHLEDMHITKAKETAREQQAYAEGYTNYLKFTLSTDPIAAKSRDKFSVSGPSTEIPGPVTPEPKPEGRTSGRRFASERDLERVLQASMREEDERRERELRAQKEKYRSEKEAEIPDMYWDAEEKARVQFTDRSGFLNQSELVSAWHVLPPVNNFTEQEVELFEKRYLEVPKQWGRIADALPHRDFGTCIQYYYLMKKELKLKEKLRKQPKRRKKGRGKQRSSALVSELGNGEPETEENHENGENGENRRRPRRAAAPTWGFEQPPNTESENGTPASTPGRRGASVKGEEKVDGRRGRRKTVKDKEPKQPKSNPTLAAAPAPNATGRSRSRSDNKGQNMEFQGGTPIEGRQPPPFEQQQQQQSGIQHAFSVQQPKQEPRPQTMERQQAIPTSSSITDVIAAPSLRPEPPQPPPQPAMATFNLAQPQQERKAPTQASSYWSVSESNDFPLLLRAFGSDWAAIAAHMGSKTAVMVKNYYVRQKDHGKPEWEQLMREADGKRERGEKRPEPPQPTIGGRGRRYDNSGSASASRPLAAAPGTGDLMPDTPQPKTEAGGQPGRAAPFSSGYGYPIAQTPAPGQVQAQAQAHPAGGQQPLPIQQQPPVAQPPPQAMSPGARPMRAPPPHPFSYHDREREQSQQRVALPGAKQAIPQQDAREQRHAPPVQQMQSAQPELAPERQQMELQRKMEREHERERERIERERIEREREREVARQPEHRPMRIKPEADTLSPHQFEPFGHRQPTLPPRDPLALPRHTTQDPRHEQPRHEQPRHEQPRHEQPRHEQPRHEPPRHELPRHEPHRHEPPRHEPPRHGVPSTYAPLQPGSQPVRSLLSDGPPAQSPPPPLAPSGPRPPSSLQQRMPTGPGQDVYGSAPPQSAPSALAAAPPRPPEPRKTSNIMSLLNDDPPPPPKRVNDVSSQPSRPSPTPPPQTIGRPSPRDGPPPLRREQEGPYSPFGRAQPGPASAMPPLKPTAYALSPQPQPSGGPRSALGLGSESPALGDRDYYRQHPYSAGHQPSASNSPQNQHRFQPPGQPSMAYQGQGYPTSYSSAPPQHGSSPPPQYGVHNSASRGRDMPPGARDSWPPAGHQPPPSNWANQGPKSSQPPPPQPSWAPQHPGSSGAGGPTSSWATAPPPQQAHHTTGLRDDRGSPMYGSSGAPQQQHQMQGRYAPVSSARGPDPGQPQPYQRYASTPGPGPGPPPPRDLPPRSYTPSAYDARGPPPPQGPGGYSGPDPRDLQLRDAQLRDPREHRDPRDAHGLRPHEYDRRMDQYGR